MNLHPKNAIRTWALIAVAISTVFVIVMGVWLTSILSASNWCARAIGAAQEGNRPESAINGCFNLLRQQVGALAWNSHIYAATVGISLLVLVVIVLAGGRVSFKADKTGFSGDIVRDDAPLPPVAAAREVAGAAVDKADEIAAEAIPPPEEGK